MLSIPKTTSANGSSLVRTSLFVIAPASPARTIFRSYLKVSSNDQMRSSLITNESCAISVTDLGVVSDEQLLTVTTVSRAIRDAKMRFMFSFLRWHYPVQV